MYDIHRIFRLTTLLLALLVSACGGHVYHVVERGETLYSIGWLYGYDYRQIAEWNAVRPPYALAPGQRLRVVPPEGTAGAAAVPVRSEPRTPVSGVVVEERGISAKGSGTAAPTPGVAAPVVAATPAPATGQAPVSVANQPIRWQWPTENVVILRSFSGSDPGRRGLDLGGSRGARVMAVAPGRVVYTGGGLPRYGQLIIIKHSDMFLSAYAHNEELLVKEGDEVAAGQLIATMGSTGTTSIRLHFQIRENGKPVDPMKYLPSRKG